MQGINISSAQLVIHSGTTLTIHDSTIVDLRTEQDTLKIISGAHLFNQGLVELGQNYQVNEAPGYPIRGNGKERSFQIAAVNNLLLEPGQLGFAFMLTTNSDTVILIRKHDSLIDQLGRASVQRWFELYVQGQPYPHLDSLTFRYDSTELNGQTAYRSFIHGSDTTQNLWINHGGVPSLYHVTRSSIDSSRTFTLFPFDLILDSVSSDSLCTGDTLSVSFHTNGLSPPYRNWHLHLSDAMGNWSTFTELDSVQNTDTATLQYIIPYPFLSSSDYRISVSSHPDFSLDEEYPFNMALHEVGVPVVIQSGNQLSSSISCPQYQWYMNGIALSGATDSSLNAITDGDYCVECTNAIGCNAFSDTLAFVYDRLLTYSNPQIVRVYPNPSMGTFQILGCRTCTVTLRDAVGRMMYYFETDQKEVTLPGELKNGWYRIWIKDEEGITTDLPLLIIR